VKLAILIPCLNEEQTLAETLAALPRRVDGFDEVEWIVIDDGSQDRTAEVAQLAGADQILRLPHHEGLGVAFAVGIKAALDSGADVIAQTDADNQYDAKELDTLAAAVLAGADMVVGCRDVAARTDFSSAKRLVHRWGSRAFRFLSGTVISDPVSGFRAYSRRTAERIRVGNRFSYTLEGLLQAGREGWQVREIPISSRPAARPSRLARSGGEFLGKSLLCVLRALALHRPFVLFAWALVPWVFLARLLAESKGTEWALTQVAALSALLAGGIWLYRKGLAWR